MNELAGYLGGKVICCGDFNAHSTLWGEFNDGNGQGIEELMASSNLVCLNDGSGTRFNGRTGSESAIDLTFVSDSGGVCSWVVIKRTTVGSDHYPIVIKVGVSIYTIIQREYRDVF